MAKVPELGGDDIFQQMQQRERERVRGAVIAAPTLAPDEMGEATRIAKRQGKPVGVVADNLSTFKEDERLNAFEAAGREDPALGDWISDPVNVALARDEMPSIADLTRSNAEYNKRFTKSQQWGFEWKKGVIGLKRALTNLPLSAAIEKGRAAEGEGITGYDNLGLPIYGRPETVELLGQVGKASIRKIAQEEAAATAKIRKIPSRPSTDAMLKSSKLGDAWQRFMIAPVSSVVDVGLSSAPQAGVTVVATVVTRNPRIAMAVGGASSFAMEYGTGVTDYLGNQGIDVTDAAAVEKALLDDKTLTSALNYAKVRGVIVGAFDAASGGVASKMLVPGAVRSTVAREAVNSLVAQPVAQMAMGASGEAAAQLATTGKIEAGAVLAEAIGETFTAPIEVGAFAFERARNARLGRLANVAKAGMEKAHIDKVVGAALSLDLRKNAPDQFEALVERSNPGAMVYVQAEDLITLYQSESDASAAMADLTGNPEAWAEATATGGEVAIPLSKYATNLAEQHETIGKRARLQPGQSVDADAAMPSAEEIQADVAKFFTDAKADEARSDGALGDVYDDFYGQLVGEYGEGNATEFASKMQSVYRSLSDRTGMPVQQLRDRFVFNINGALGANPRGAALPEPGVAGVDGFIENGATRTRITQRADGDGALLYEEAAGPDGTVPTSMVVTKDGTLAPASEATGMDESVGEDSAWTPPDAQAAAAVSGLLQRRAMTTTGSPERASVDAAIRDAVTGETQTLDQEGRVSERLPTATKDTKKAAGRPDPHLSADQNVTMDLVNGDEKLVAKYAALITNNTPRPRKPVIDKKTGKPKPAGPPHRPYNSFTTASTDPKQIIADFIKFGTDNLLWLYDQVPADTRERSKLWYVGGREIVDRWVKRYDGLYTDTQMAAALAAMSPKMGWDTNVSLSERIVDTWTNHQSTPWDARMDAVSDGIAERNKKQVVNIAAIRGKGLTEIAADESATPEQTMLRLAMWVSIFDQATNPRSYRLVTPEGGFAGFASVKKTKKNPTGEATAAYGNGFGPVAKVLSVLIDGSQENISRNLGNAHKVRSFYNNLFDPSDPSSTTIDTHAVAAPLLMPLAANDAEPTDNFSGVGSQPMGLSGTYVLYHEMYRLAAEQRGVLPREMQSITWEAIRGLFNPAFKTATKRNPDAFDKIWEDHNAGLITLEEARNAVVTISGSIEQPRWVGSDTGLDEGAAASSYTGELLGPRESDGAAGPGDGAAAATGVPADGRVSTLGGRESDAGADRAGGDPSGGAAPLAGYPDGGPGPDLALVQVAQDYAAANGIPLLRQGEYVKVSAKRATRIADEYEVMPHAPSDPAVAAAYADLIRQTSAQYEALTAAGYKFWFADPDADPYGGNPSSAMRDLRATKSMAVFPSEAGFGSSELDVADNPLLADTGLRWNSGSADGPLKTVLANDLFRAVHDAFGHGLEGSGFRAQGEENAWQAHSRLFTGPALAALTSETRGQNSHVNFNKKPLREVVGDERAQQLQPESWETITTGDHNRTAAVNDTQFADQKTGLMPDWTWTEGVAPDQPEDLGDNDGQELSTLYQSASGSDAAGDRRARGLPAASSSGEGVGARGWSERPIQPDAVSVTGVHYSAARGLQALDGTKYGTNHKGAEIKRLQNAAWTDPRMGVLQNRVYFYPADSKLVGGESMVGRAGKHEIRLDNLYDIVADVRGLWRSSKDDNAGEMAVIDAGFDGYRTPDMAVVLGTAPIPVATDTLYQSEQPFYSALLRAVEEAKGAPKKGDATTWKGWLDGAQRRGEIKQAERDWLGIDAWLGSQGSVTRDQLADFIRANEVQVQEVTLGDNQNPSTAELVERAMRLFDEKNRGATSEQREDAESVAKSWAIGDTGWGDAAREMEVDAVSLREIQRRGDTSTKFASYQTPGGENYREVLLTLPPGERTPEVPAIREPVFQVLGALPQDFPTMEEAEAYVARVQSVAAGEMPGSDQIARLIAGNPLRIESNNRTVVPAEPSRGNESDYRSSHFDQPNILAHVRFNERTDADGKRVLFLEEIQSDWHQAGRKGGYAKPVSAATHEVGEVKLSSRSTEPDGFGVFERGPDGDQVASFRSLSEADAFIASGGLSDGIPNAPFKATDEWAMLAFKRMVRHAAENGFDRIAWTTGEQQAARYDLSKHVDKITYADEGGGMYSLVATRDGRTVFDKDDMTAADIEETIGKEMAERIVNGAGTKIPGGPEMELSGLDLKVGGDGMKGFYDKILPSAVNKWGKKFGARVGTAKINVATPPAGGFLTNEDVETGQRDALSDQPSIDITPAMREAALSGQALFQKTQTNKPRGSITFAKDAQGRRVFDIQLMKDKDFSTFLHEGAHAYLLMLGDLAGDANAPDQVKADYAKALEWLGVEDGNIGVEQHEKWARGWELYYREGKAPSASLRRSFAQFKVWLTAIYRTASQLNVELTDEVRGVFDRMLATDDEIAAAQDTQHLGSLLMDASTSGMNLEQYEAYVRAVQAARADAEATLGAEILREEKRATDAYNGEQRRRVYAEQLALAREMPAYRALRWFRRGLMPDGSPVEAPMRLDKDAVLDLSGESVLKLIHGAYALRGGVTPDFAASVLGFGSGSELMQSLIEAMPLEQYVKEQTDAVMAEQYPDPMKDGTLPDRAMAAVHSKRQVDLMLLEVQALEANVDGKVRTQAGVLREVARQIVSDKRARDIQPATYRAAEAKAGREAFKAAAAGDMAGALVARRRQLLNTMLFREATRARADAEKLGKRMAKYSGNRARGRFGKAGAEYLEQIDALLERFDFRVISNKSSANRARLSAWIKAKEDEGITIDLPDKLVDEAFRKPWKDLTVGEMREIGDAVKHIAHLSSLKNRLLSELDKRTFDEAADAMAESVARHHKIEPIALDLAPSWMAKFGNWMAEADAVLTKTEFVMRWLDGDRANGPMWRMLFQPFVDAERAENKMMDILSERMREIFAPYDRGQLAAEKIYIAEAKTANFAGNFTRSSLVAIGLNWGNPENREALMAGYGWSEEQMAAILNRITPRDWDAIEASWVLIDSLWPEIAKLQRALTGLVPEKVAADPFKLPGGRVIRGGYYPLKAEAKLSLRAKKRDAAQTVKEQFGGGFASASTRQGHTKARVGFGGQPVKLDLNVLTEHLANVVHDITHRRPVMDAARMLEDKRIEVAIKGAAGTAVYDQLNPWLVAISGAQVTQPTTYIDAMMRHVRVGATVVNMGLKITTAIVQPMGHTQTIHMIGTKWVALGHADWLANKERGLSFAMARSQVLPDRQKSFDRDVKDTLTRLQDGSRMDDVRRSFFILTGMMDMSVVVPAWMGAYRKAIEGNVDGVDAGHERDAIAYADSMVRLSQSSGSVKDLATIQRGTETQRLFTMFYSYFSVLYNLQRRAIRNTKSMADVPSLAAAAMWLWFVPAVLSEVIAGRGPEEDEEWLEWAKKNGIKFASYPLQTIPVVRDIINGTDKYGYSPSPAFDAYEMLGKVAVAAVEIPLTERELERKDLKSVALAAGYWGQLPARQLWTTGEYWYDVASGEEQPESVLEFMRNSAFTRPN